MTEGFRNEEGLKERQATAGRILRHIGENWKEPLNWSFTVRHHTATGGYRIVAHNAQSFSIVISADRAKSYHQIDKVIKELEILAVNS